MVRQFAAFVTSAATALATAAPLAATTLAISAGPVAAATTSVTLVGDLQSELGCSADWQADCAATHLARDGQTSTFSKTFDVPAGSYQFKVTINDSWDENYGAGGVKGGPNLPLVIQGPAELTFSYDDTTHKVGVAPADLPAGATSADASYAKDSLRTGATRERYYFLMADRFANGDTGNDTGGLTGGRLTTGFDPTDQGFYHGGDLKGVINKLDYIKGLGTTAIWLTPSFKNKPVQGTGADASAGYHGYWVTDFTQIDPHLGTNADMKALIAAAHAKGMKVYFDIITNHTADVIHYAQNQYTYRDKATYPYKDADGQPFDDAAYAEKPGFPAMNPATSFPYTPVVDDAEKNIKVPAWLNDVTNYHNRGDSTYAGESATYGDFSGLDDLFTEKLSVEQGMEDIYKKWVDFGVDGFRIDTAKNVNIQFWEKFSPAMLAEAAKVGNKNFFMFGEVYDGHPSVMSEYTTTGKLPATLDFGFQGAAVSWVQGKAGTDLRDEFASDDYFTDNDSNAYELPTFLGNHDMGRVAMMLNGTSSSKSDLLAKVKLADDLMYLTRGNPITYYGDEQGFIGSGGDKDAREDLFATKVDQYATEANLTGPSGSMDRYATNSPLYQHISALAKLRGAYPALADGAQVHRYASSGAGVFAFSRIDRDQRIEYVVALNNATTPKSATFDTYGHNQTFRPLYGASASVRSAKDGRLTVTVPSQSASVWVASSPMDKPKSAPAIYLTSPTAGGVVAGRAPITAAIPQDTFAQVSFLVRPVGTSTWQPLGTDDNAPYRVYDDVTGYAKGTLLEYRAVAKDSAGHLSAVSSYGIVGDAAPSTGGGTGVGPVTQPDAVSVPGSDNSEMGCSGDWQPDCAQAQLALDGRDQIWKGEWTLPAGDYEYKAAIDKSWDENYGAGGAKNGSNIPLHATGAPVHFYYDHATHYVTTDAQGPILTAPGSFQSELGCPADWSPDCMRPWLQDPDGDGVYTWSTNQIPAGSYEFKVAQGLNWDTNWGDGGVPGGNNITLNVPSDGTVVTIAFDYASKKTTVTTSRAGSSPDLTKTKAIWVSPDTIAVPDSMLGGQDAALVKWELAWSQTGGLAIDAEDITGGTTAPLSYARPVSAATVQAHPELKGYLALTLDKKTAKLAPQILTGQVAVASFDSTHQTLDATGMQIPYVLDALYSAQAGKRTYGVTFAGAKPSYRVWAPTAQSVDLLTWPSTAADDAPASAATRVAMKRQSNGSWTASTGSRGDRYLYDVQVWAPTVGKVVHNQVTDPYSTGLTLDSTKSVAVDLADPTYRPALWSGTASPKLAKSVDSTIYELHVRDFSISDQTVPAAHRGSYLAFADDGDGTKHLRALAKAGLNTVHLLPTFDIASIEEDPAKQETPQSAGCPDLRTLPPDSDQQQACIDRIRSKDAFNWGYDPLHWGVPEGSYASSATAAEGGTRIAEFRTMVGALHQDGLRVVLDQVFNHTPGSGEADNSVLDQIVPGYYQRLDKTGAVYTSTCCQNVATEHSMAEKIMVDTVVRWAKDYKVDGFRFDLMGHASKANMLAVRSALDALTMPKDGVDGKSIYLYGEGWNFGEVANNALFTQATQGQLGGTGIGTFSDRLRDAVRGGSPFDDDPRKQGFGTGEQTDPNGAAINADAASSLKHDTDLVELGLAGNLRAFTFRSASTGQPTRGDGVDYDGQPAGYADQPDEVISYVDAHDNETIFDELTYKLPVSTSMADRVRMNTVALATTALAQTPSFWHAGADLLRSKSLDRNSYDSGDWFNALSWTGQDNGFGHGLPLKGDNGAKWSYMQPLLADLALKPTANDVQHASAMAQDLLKLRFSTPLFRLGSAAAIEAKVGFPASGTADAHPGVIAMRIDDTVGADVDPSLKGLVVVFNASPAAVTQKVPGLAGQSLSLSPVQVSGADSVVKGSSWDATTGSATVPGRTVAVFVQR